MNQHLEDRLGLGTGPLGGLYHPVDESDAVECIERALERGIRHLDTAPHYGYGLSEVRVGKAIRGWRRDELKLVTKVGRLLRPPRPGDRGRPRYLGTPDVRSTFDFSREGVRRSMAESLERLGVDRVDVALVHDPDDHIDLARAQAIPALVEMKNEGVVSSIGVGTNRVETAELLLRECELDCVLVAGRLSLLDQSALSTLLPLCRQCTTTYVAGGVFNSGVLASWQEWPTFDYQPAPPSVLDRARLLADACALFDTPLAAAAVQFPLRYPPVERVLVGCRSADEVDQDVELFRREIPAELWTHLEEAGLVKEAGSSEVVV